MDTRWKIENYISNITEIDCGYDKKEYIEFSLSPNPTSDKLKVNILNQDNFDLLTFEILDALGTSLERGTSNNSDFEIELSKLLSGVYYIKINIEDTFSLKQFIIAK